MVCNALETVSWTNVDRMVIIVLFAVMALCICQMLYDRCKNRQKTRGVTCACGKWISYDAVADEYCDCYKIVDLRDIRGKWQL